MKKVAIQGINGSFHDQATRAYFGREEVELLCCRSFEEVFAVMQSDIHTLGVVAIENTIAGSLLHNYELLRESGARIVGEHKLHIEHSLLCLPGDTPETLTEVNSHPVALMQCRRFLRQHPQLKVVEAEDTAGAAERISREQLHGHAAICSKYAAPLYGMKVLEEAIEDNKQNYTRFLVVSMPSETADASGSLTTDKSSIVFSVPHEEGCLSQILSIFSFYRINMTKIQSLPIVGRKWEYLFYVDVTYDSYTRYRQSIAAIEPLTRSLSVLGEYRSFETNV